MSNGFVMRSLDEVRFWSRIMKEHSLFLKLGFRCDDTQLINEANHFYAVFEEIERRSNTFTPETDPEVIKRFNVEVHNAASHIWAFKRKVLGLILSCQLPGANNFPLLVDHTSREAFYFRNRLEELNTGRLDPLPDAIINENVFFLRIMADHAKFIGHLLDPSERQLVEQSRNFSQDFDQLLFQARDLESMRPQSQTVPLLDQFLDQNRISVKSLRDFKKTAKELIESCRIKSIIHPLLADHVFREAERFLFIIDMLESSLTKTPAR
ncbi:DUF2935 domain-containing protein [Paenibacillus validus]|uniref:DUF2935 domain-containing protein n=1 Tax=Paenibacillus validus TaxID=44253 RepID=A0A7X2ZC40_9BACL|nr:MULTISPECIES: DUF2935 domain-containing protein [Paenibacillus]MED4601716.1 DUF2935 domain-containing protein [Paenibacillus validus]MED4608744.1 DUF2935 domain-containing protein [Paenibacillus validus]MUG71386.1 DUF2935 domain-containing protein [Paenibacillus validus]